MAIMPKEVQEAFKNVKTFVFATASAQGQPNGNIIGIKRIVDDETVYVSDQFFNKSLANLKENDKVAIIITDGDAGYELYGTARYVDEGPEFEAEKKWVDEYFASKGKAVVAKGGCFVHVDAVYNQTSGPDSGAQIA
ncbi:pyridoxamine 5'-phosphate oxidase family protein [Curtanaerobium respiraculi]|uniref:pyridoxamine 5'-phosphate oxidase family protein n=1 Tax=Curtanaerobium respiraculi TaxID=2949669 RepID=UPI0024B390C1|nr:pyridoxamine 5'-phosphate oxidase family protein [Curtanaerobium respiraculi]